MLVLFETAAGFALFRVQGGAATALTSVEKSGSGESSSSALDSAIKEHFGTPAAAAAAVELKAFERFRSTADALTAATGLLEGTVPEALRSFLADNVQQKKKKDAAEKLIVSEPKLRGAIARDLGLEVVASELLGQEVLRGIRTQMDALLPDVSKDDMSAMSLGLSHSLSRFKLKFSPDKVDTMVVQAVSLLDDLDKELNTYAMRVREWYGWHFPELGKIIADNILFAKVAKKLGSRTNAATTDLGEFLPEELEDEVKAAEKISMGTELADRDVETVRGLCDQVIEISEYREQLSEYLGQRMRAIAPNLTLLVGELVGARLIARAGSLLTLAKYPASTVQILGAEKALFRALKTKHETPKYGLIFHASLVGQAAPKDKGKISRVLAAKASLGARFDALGEDTGTTADTTVGEEGVLKVEQRLRLLSGSKIRRTAGKGKHVESEQRHSQHSQQQQQVRNNKAAGAGSYNAVADVVDDAPAKKVSKRKRDEDNDGDDDGAREAAAAVEEPAAEEPKLKKRKKDKKDKKDKKSKKSKKDKKKSKKSKK
jgi:nucleolar protein 58